MSYRKMQVFTQTALVIGFLASVQSCYGMTTGTINVSTTVPGSCTIQSTSNIAFPNYTGAAQIHQQFNNTVVLNCLVGSIYYTTLDFGQNTTGGTNRQMSNGIDNIVYQIYSDGGFSQVWGETLNSNTNPVNATAAMSLTVNLDAFGEINAGQNVSAGAYSDTLTTQVIVL